MSKRSVAVMLGTMVGCLLIAGCGVSEEKLNEAEGRLKTLSAKGVPDSVLTDAKMQLVNARSALRTGNANLATRSADSMLSVIASVEAWYDEQMEKLAPDVKKLKATLEERKGGLSGEQLAVAESLLTVIDSLVAKDWLLQARTMLTGLDTTFSVLEQDEERMEKVVSALPGFWVEQAASAEKGLSAVRTKKFTFKKDGTVELTETMKGKSRPDLKEDWAFQSWGTWRAKGDTVLIHVQREKCLRKTFQNLVDGAWKKHSEPAYDSTFTDDHKDVFITYTYIKENMKKR